MAPYKLELHVKLNGIDKIISKTVMGNKIIEPEACTLLDAPYVPIPDIYVYCDNIKFGLMGTILNKDIEIFSNLYDNNGRKIMEKKYSSKQVADIFNSTCFWKRYYGQNFVFHTDMDSNVDYYLNMINNIMDQVSCFTGIPFRQEVHYYITDEIINLYDLTSDFPITQSNCLAFDNRIMVCLYWNELTIKSSGDMVDCQLNQAYQALYHDLLHSMDMQIDEKEYHSAIERFRKGREVLRYCSCDAIDQKINLLKG